MCNRQVVLVSRPTGRLEPSNFGIRESTRSGPVIGEVLVRIMYLAMDPWLRPAINDATLVPSGGVVPGDVVGRVIESRHPLFRPGDFVQGPLGWQEYAAAPWSMLRKIDPTVAPVSTALGVLGSSGLTAYFGLFGVAHIRAGDTVAVSAAAGAVGSAAAQMARLAGCRVIGIAGSQEKVRHLREDLQLAAAVNYRLGPEWRAELAAACPFGIDVYFDNVGGDVSDAVLPLLNQNARVAICGQISEYDRAPQPRGSHWPSAVLQKRARVRGFLVTEFARWFPAARHCLTRWLRTGLLRYRERIEQGLENAPRAFVGMLHGENVGKQLVKLV
jgi:NADPH-dependent curcumin reductase CurA